MTGRIWRPRMRLSGIGDPPPDFDISRIYEGTTNPYAGIGDFTYGSGPERNFGLPGTSGPPEPPPPTTPPTTGPGETEYNNQPNQGGGSDQGNGGSQGDRDAGRDNGEAESFGDWGRSIAMGLGTVFGGPLGMAGGMISAGRNNNLGLAGNILDMFNGDENAAAAAIASMNQAGGVMNPELGGRNRDDAGLGGFGWDGSDAGMEGADNEQAGMDARSGDGDGPDIAVANGGGIGEVSGDGDGRDDKIPALLSDGEHVIPADVVSAMGRGSTKAGHKKLNDMILKEREKNRKTLGKLPPPKG